MKLLRKRLLVVIFLGLVVIVLIGCQPQAVLDTSTIEPINTVGEKTKAPSPTPEDPIFEEPNIPFFFGVDLSYVNEMDDCGGVYNLNGESQDAFELFANNGANLVRARLWHNPDWTEYSTLDDVERSFGRAKNAGMYTLLAMHYSDNWADPGKQAIPQAWVDVSEDDLPDVLYQYTYDVLNQLYMKGLLPDFVQVGNEINSGLVKRTDGLDWPRDARLINAGIRAIRDFNSEHNSFTKIVLHVAQPDNAGWWFREARENAITDFDVIGLSYYPQWSSFRPGDVGPHTAYLRKEFGKEVMIVETAYPWTLDQVDETADIILNQGIRGYPITIGGQRQFLIDLTQSLISNGGWGVVYWEPAWISTECFTRWGQGSHWENATFFDFQNDNELHQGINFLSYNYYFPPHQVDGIIDESYGGPFLSDDMGDNFEDVPHLDLLDLYISDDDKMINLGLTIAGDIFANPWGGYFIYIDTTFDDQGADVDVDKRPITAAAPYLPEYRVDISFDILKGTVSGTYNFYEWDGQEWQTLAMVGGVGISNGKPSIIELQIPEEMLNYPKFINVSVVSVGRGRVHSAGDILGTTDTLNDWSDPVILDKFVRYDLKD